MSDEAVLDDALSQALHRADLDELVRMIDSRTARPRLGGSAAVYGTGLATRSRPDASCGRPRHSPSTALPFSLRPNGRRACSTRGRGDSRSVRSPKSSPSITPGRTCATDLEPGPRAALVAHERALRGDHIDAADAAGLPDVLEVPYTLAEWEPAYRLADYHDVDAEFPSPDVPAAFESIELSGIDATAGRDRRRRPGPRCGPAARRAVDGVVQRSV